MSEISSANSNLVEWSLVEKLRAVQSEADLAEEFTTFIDNKGWVESVSLQIEEAREASPDETSAWVTEDGGMSLAIFDRPIGVYELNKAPRFIRGRIVFKPLTSTHFDSDQKFFLQRCVGIFAIAWRHLRTHQLLDSRQEGLASVRVRHVEDEAAEYLARRTLQDSVLELYPKAILIIRDGSIHQASGRVSELFGLNSNDDAKQVLMDRLPGAVRLIIDSLEPDRKELTLAIKYAETLLHLRVRRLSDGILVEVGGLVAELLEEFHRPLETDEIAVLPDSDPRRKALSDNKGSLDSYLFRVATRLPTRLAALEIQANKVGDKIARWQVALLVVEEGFFWEDAFAFGSLNARENLAECKTEFRDTLSGSSRGTLCRKVATDQKGYGIRNIRDQVRSRKISFDGFDSSGGTVRVEYRDGNEFTETELTVPVKFHGKVIGLIDVQTDWTADREDGIGFIDAMHMIQQIAEAISPIMASFQSSKLQVRLKAHLEQLGKATKHLRSLDPKAIIASIKEMGKVIRPLDHRRHHFFIEFLWYEKDSKASLVEHETFYEWPRAASQQATRFEIGKVDKSINPPLIKSVCSAAFRIGLVVFQDSNIVTEEPNKRIHVGNFQIEKYAEGTQKYKSELAVRVDFGQSTFGVLNIETMRPDAFGGPEREVFQIYARTLGAVFNAARGADEIERLQQETKSAMADAAHVENNQLLNAESCTDPKTVREMLIYQQDRNSYHAALFDPDVDFRPVSLVEALKSLTTDYFQDYLIRDKPFMVDLSSISPDIFVSLPLGRIGGLAVHSIVANMVKNKDRHETDDPVKTVVITATIQRDLVLLNIDVGTPKELLRAHYTHLNHAGLGIKEIYRAARWLSPRRKLKNPVSIGKEGGLTISINHALQCVALTSAGSWPGWISNGNVDVAADRGWAVVLDADVASNDLLSQIEDARHRLPSRRGYVGSNSERLEAVGFKRLRSSSKGAQNWTVDKWLALWAERYFESRPQLVVSHKVDAPSSNLPHISWQRDGAKPDCGDGKPYIVFVHQSNDLAAIRVGRKRAEERFFANNPWKDAISQSADSLYLAYDLASMRIVLFDNRLLKFRKSQDAPEAEAAFVWIYPESEYRQCRYLAADHEADVVVLHQRAIPDDEIEDWWSNLNESFTARLFLTSQVQRQRNSVKALSPLPDFVDFRSINSALSKDDSGTKYALGLVFRP